MIPTQFGSKILGWFFWSSLLVALDAAASAHLHAAASTTADGLTCSS
jgi:hypothetical protein